MFLEFIDDRTTHYLDQQYMLGPSLLIAPVFVPENEFSEYYLPAGRWTSLFYKDRSIEGPKWMKEVVPLNDIPVWVKEGSVLLLGPGGAKRPDYKLNEGVEVELYGINDGFSNHVEVPSGKGTQVIGFISIQRIGREIRIQIQGNVQVTSITLISSLTSMKSVVGGTKQGNKVIIETNTEEIVMQLHDPEM